MMRRMAGKTKWDQAPPGDLDLATINASIHDLASQLAEATVPAQFRASHPAASSSKMLTDVKDVRDGLSYWTRLLAEFSVLRLNTTQKEVARMLNVSTQTINRWVNDPLLTE
jgi:DNA-binding transcriptional regulator YiaG